MSHEIDERPVVPDANLVSPAEAIKECLPVMDFPLDPKLIAEMRSVMVANSGVGLAAPQIGVYLKLFVFQMKPKLPFFVVCNPKMSVLKLEYSVAKEGCLSLPGARYDVARWNSIRLDAQDENGKEFWWHLRWDIARVVQHEISHLQGELIDGTKRGIGAENS